METVLLTVVREASLWRLRFDFYLSLAKDKSGSGLDLCACK